MRQFEPQPDPKELYCNDPTHDSECACGAEPDWEYEKGLEYER